MKKLFTTLLVTSILAGCGGGGSDSSSTPVANNPTNPTTPTNPTNPNNPTVPPVVTPPVLTNTVALSVNGGMNGNYLNGLFASVTVCKPNTANSGGAGDCTTINNVIVDTGSVGLRLFDSALPSGFTLPNSKDLAGNKYAQCMQFASGVTWGSVNTADIKMNGELASNTPIEIIGNSAGNIPSSCSSLGTVIDSAKELGANGILGIGLFNQDCGNGCATVVNNTLYYVCTTTSCVNSTIPVNMQVQNPISKFAKNNNGSIIVLNDVPENGAVSTTGTLFFGIGTESNNTKSLSVVNTNNRGLINVTYNGKVFTESFIDSGSSVTTFATPDIKKCTTLTEFFCPDVATSLPITISSANNSNAVNSSIRIANAEALLNRNTNIVFNNVIGSTAVFNNNTIDLGLSFFLGKSVATGIEGKSSNLGTGTYFAF